MPFLTTALAVGGLAAAGASAGLSYAGQKGVADASKSAAQLQAEEQQKSLDFQKQQWDTQQKNQAPFLKAGQTAIGDLSSLLAPGGELSQGWTGQFTAPTEAEAEATPGFQSTLKNGLDAINNSAAAQGSILSGGTIAAQDKYAQGLAAGNYQQAFNNAYTQYNSRYNTFKNNQTDKFNRLASVAGLGQTTAGQLGQEGTAASNNVTNTNLTTGAQIGQDYLNAASSRASGYNAIGNSFSNYSNMLPLYSLMAQQQQQNQGPGTGPLMPVD